MKTTCGLRILVAKSCIHCGELKMACHFPRSGPGYRTSHCNACKNKLGKPLTKRHQQTAQKGAVKHYQPWTDAEVDQLLELSAEGLTGPQIAIKLNRSVYAIYTMRNKLKKEPT